MPNGVRSDRLAELRQGTGREQLLGRDRVNRPVEQTSEGAPPPTPQNAGILPGSPQSFRRIFDVAAQELNQPAAGEEDIDEGFKLLNRVFDSEVRRQLGRAPTSEEQSAFLAQNLTVDFARDFIDRRLNDSIVRENIVRPVIEDIRLQQQAIQEPAQPIATDAEETLRQRVSEAFNLLRGGVEAGVERAFIPARRRLREEQAALGLLRQPTATVRQQQLEAERGRTLAEQLGSVASQEARGQLGLAEAIAGIQERERRAQQQAAQFGQQLGLQRRQLGLAQREAERQRGLQTQQFRIAERLGRLQAEAGQPSGLQEAVGLTSAILQPLSLLAGLLPSGGATATTKPRATVKPRS